MTDFNGAYIYDCMMIHRRSDGIAERLGLGTILESAWHQAGEEACLKNIVLG
jgi:hypothetical protein